MPAHSYAADLELLKSAALEAGHIAMKYFKADVSVWEKKPGDPVSEADLVINDFLSSFLRGARPDYGWLSEETTDSTERLGKSRIFVIDPIDGTRAFINGNPHFSIVLAILEGENVVASVIYAPVHDELFEAERGGGAFCNGKPIHVSDRRELKDARMIADQRMFDRIDWPTAWPDLVLPEEKPNSTAYRMALVADGRWDGVMVLWRKFDWDVVAATLLITEAGGRVSNHTSEPYIFNQEVAAQQSLIAAGPVIHEQIIKRCGQVRLPHPSRKTKLGKASAVGDKSMSEPVGTEQLLHIVIGGELKDVAGIEFENLQKVDFVGAFPNYETAYNAWKSAAQRTVDSAETRYFILHAHKLLDPETGAHHSV